MADIPGWAFDVAAERCNRSNKRPLTVEQWRMQVAFHELAKTIAEHEEPPVDPVLEAIEDALCSFYSGPGGSWPGTNPMAKAVVEEFAKRGIELSRTLDGSEKL